VKFCNFTEINRAIADSKRGHPVQLALPVVEAFGEYEVVVAETVEAVQDFIRRKVAFAMSALEEIVSNNPEVAGQPPTPWGTRLLASPEQAGPQQHGHSGAQSHLATLAECTGEFNESLTQRSEMIPAM
jgi:hypothetical protein